MAILTAAEVRATPRYVYYNFDLFTLNALVVRTTAVSIKNVLRVLRYQIS